LRGTCIVLAFVGILLMAVMLPACRSEVSTVTPLTSISWDQAMSNSNPTLAEFGRGTCIPCKQMKPILEELAQEYKGRLNVVIVDVDRYSVLTRQYGIMAIPTQIFLDKSGKEVSRHVGFFPKESIVAELAKIGME
jgi:thioredoxin 1